MTLEKFKNLIELLKEADVQVDGAYKAKVDLIEFTDVYSAIITNLILEIYGEEGGDWFSWFVYENNFGEGPLEAYSKDGEVILKTIDEMWEFLEEKRKIKNNVKIKSRL